ncbi:Suppressor of RPS4-RLD 1 [Turnera subulata]|uniref:Suppressor of RPS4-RLD 1 n=1 Tax=Turnera subulata TaxID=218843 RepID=A0A9Q0GHT4_9ROSI|nr:Suppressor of RPS4-RLD 1 [Turnera subulata]
MASSSSAISERVELAKFCASRDWSKAIRVLDSLVAQSAAVQDICNRAFCYSQLELNKHVIKDCDRALQLDPSVLQAYILKEDNIVVSDGLSVSSGVFVEALVRRSGQIEISGRALLSLGRKEDALLVWEQGYAHALSQSADLKQLLELEELLTVSKQDKNVTESKSSVDVSESILRTNNNGKSSETLKDQNKLRNIPDLRCEARDGLDIHGQSGVNFRIHSGISDKLGGESPTPAFEPGIHMNGQSSEAGAKPSLLSDKLKSSCQLSDTFNTSCGTGDNFEIASELSNEATGDRKRDNLVNGTHNINDNESCPHPASELSSITSVVRSNSSDTSEIRSKSTNKIDMHNEGSDEAKRHKKFCITRISKTKSISVDFRLSRGIAQVNEGKYASAIAIFDQVLREDPAYPEALIGRGTAYAFQRELEAAISDFTKAIQSNPSAGEAWKRRGQARAALGEAGEAIEDLTKALEFEPNSPDILHERGIVNFKFKDFVAAVEDLSACVKLDGNNKSAYTYLGLAFSSLGEYKRAEESHLKAIQLDRNFLEAWGHLTQFYQDLANSTKALDCVQQLLQIEARFAKAYYLRGLLLHGMGEHRKAIKDLSVCLSIESSNIECLYLRASCHHAIGEYGEAVKDYDATLDLELDSVEKFVLQCLAFYQKELALYTASKINSEFCWFDIDGDIDPLFKEYWCKRLHPKNVCEKVFRQPPLRDSLKRGKLRKQDVAMTKQKTALLAAADSIGKKIQYDCAGFLHNRRQHRMAGLAAVEIAQKVSKAWRSLQSEWKHSNKGTTKYGKRGRRRINMLSQNRGGAGCSTSSSSDSSTLYGITEDRTSSRSLMSWHDVYSLAVKWRQISEPCDPVVWVNKLSEEFNSGFGSHTPMTIGQAKVVRYYQNYERTLSVAKTIMKEKLYVHNKADDVINISKDKLQDIEDAKNCSDLYKIVDEDFWLATWCNSTAFEGGEHGFDFAIRTPCIPSRWDEFDTEMAMAWEAVCNAYCGETYGSSDFDALENVRHAILRMTYYWYNFMPLSRGSAIVGFTVMLGLLLAANMEFTDQIPKGLQVDWEAILSFDPDDFIDSIKNWLYPSLKVTTSWKEYPDVATTFATTGSVVAALSSYND